MNHIPLKRFQIAEKANICGASFVPNEVIELGKGVRSMTRLTWLGDIGAVLCEKDGVQDDLIPIGHVVKATPLDDLMPDTGKAQSRK